MLFSFKKKTKQNREALPIEWSRMLHFSLIRALLRPSTDESTNMGLCEAQQVKLDGDEVASLGTELPDFEIVSFNVCHGRHGTTHGVMPIRAQISILN